MKRAIALLLAGCASTPSPTLTQPPSLTPMPTQTQTLTPIDAPVSPVSAKFVELGDASVDAASACDVRFLAIAKGRATAGTDALGEGDVLVVKGDGDLAVHGSGLAVVATYHPATCDAPPAAARSVVRASAAPELTFANGAMHAHLDVEGDPRVYFGRLAGTAPVAEHQHDSSWEILCAVEGSGTFTLAGVEHHLAARYVLVVPPATKHAWRPDPGSNLVAFQLYTPPGPQERFKKLAAGK